MTIHNHRELERKYDVDLGCVIPDLDGLPRICAVAASPDLAQVATYFDTPQLRLLAAGVTLRRRTGGDDDGWHLKVPTPGESRLEVRAPITDLDAGPPRALVDQVRVIVRDHTLAPVAELRTHRQVHRLIDEDGNLAAELCDDRVTAEAWVGRPRVEEWREWELELDSAPDSFLDTAEPLLLLAGARRAGHRSKLSRVLARDLPRTRPWRSRVLLGEKPTAGELVVGYLGQQFLRLEAQDRLLRVGDQEAVHQLRVASRRMRSALASFSPVFEAGATPALRAELRWLGEVLAEARDAQVLSERFGAALDSASHEPAPPSASALMDELGRRFREGRAHADQALSSDRYFRLLDDVEDFLDEPPLRKRGRLSAREVVPGLLGRDLDRLRKRHRRYERATSAPDKDLALHEVRKAAKRVRYAAEAAQPSIGRPARQVAAQAEAVQELLGEHQDSVVGRAFLRELDGTGRHPGHGTRTIRRLHAHEEERGVALAQAYPETVAPLLGQQKRFLV